MQVRKKMKRMCNIRENSAHCLHTFCYQIELDATGVEVAPKNIVRVLFHQNSRYDVEHILQNLYSLTLDTFGKQIADTMLDEKELKKFRPITKMKYHTHNHYYNYPPILKADQIHHNSKMQLIGKQHFTMEHISMLPRAKIHKHPR